MNFRRLIRTLLGRRGPIETVEARPDIFWEPEASKAPDPIVFFLLNLALTGPHPMERSFGVFCARSGARQALARLSDAIAGKSPFGAGLPLLRISCSEILGPGADSKSADPLDFFAADTGRHGIVQALLEPEPGASRGQCAKIIQEATQFCFIGADEARLILCPIERPQSKGALHPSQAGEFSLLALDWAHSFLEEKDLLVFLSEERALGDCEPALNQALGAPNLPAALENPQSETRAPKRRFSL